MASRKHARKRRPQVQRDDVTPQRAAHNAFASAGMARRVVPAIDLLLAAGQVTPEEHRALAYYRDQASLADCSPQRSCVDFSPRGGNGYGPGVAILSARQETERMEQRLGPLSELARRVAVDDWSLTRWCIERHGGREKAGRIVVRGSDKTAARLMANARMELRLAAGRILPGGGG